ncbi:GtrA family protein [Agaribacter marinus]|uniref:GtrA/DPMS transmembrane domain-containing protein n=1 Tax=Agaribacter marinus TaxID=1431249 RepID=A0AA37SVE3_9ALTE|nr:GtrA family protein [Agaribacter marinus]GLR70032.1 hypothetical protein GCM10007852_09400 [Agaribacter marinus]
MQFVRFCIIGTTVFAIDLIIFSILLNTLENPYISRLLSFWIAICCAWFGNATFTFSQQNIFVAMWEQFSKYFLLCHLTGVLNLAIYAVTLVLGFPTLVCFVSGVVIAMIANFAVTKRILVN